MYDTPFGTAIICYSYNFIDVREESEVLAYTITKNEVWKVKS